MSGDVGEVSAVREVDDLTCEFEETGGVAYLTVVMMSTKNSLMKRRASIPRMLLATFRIGDDSGILRRTIGEVAENQHPSYNYIDNCLSRTVRREVA